MAIKNTNKNYKNWIKELKSKIHSAQIKAALAVNSALIEFYFYLEKSISEKENVWGSKLIAQTSKDLKTEFPEMKGFSERNIKYCRRFYKFYNNSIGQQIVAQLQLLDNQSKSQEMQISQQLIKLKEN